MNREQAAKIHQRLLDANHSLGWAHAAAFDLKEEEFKAFVEPLGKMLIALQVELLPAIYEQFPDLEPPRPREIPTITSELRWEQARLPPHISESDIDAIIFSVMKPHWLKVARVVGDALQRCQRRGLPISDEALAARIQVLDETDRLESQGDLRMWRFSEVRLKD